MNYDRRVRREHKSEWGSRRVARGESAGVHDVGASVENVVVWPSLIVTS